MKRALCAALLAAMIVLCLTWAGAESYEAGTMRLLRFEGDVEILDAEGFPRFVLENVRFASGEILRTGGDGQASVHLQEFRPILIQRITGFSESFEVFRTLRNADFQHFYPRTVS